MSTALPGSTREFLGIGDNAGRDNFAATDPSFGRREDAAPFPMPGNPQNVDLDSFDDKTRKERASVFRAAAQELFRTDVTKLDDAGAWGLYHAVTESMFGLADEDGSVAFGKRAAKDPRQNIDMLRRFVKGEYTLIEDPEYTKWREMNDEEKFKYAMENETTGNKLRSYMKGERGAGFWENVRGGVGMSIIGLPAGAVALQPDAIREQNEKIAMESARRSNYETLTDEEKAKYRADVVADYDEKLSRRQTLATFLQFSQGLSDRASWMLAKSFNDGVPDSNIETLPEDERDRVYSAFSLMRGDQKSGTLLFVPTDFTDNTKINRVQLGLYGLQQSVLGLFTDTWGMTKDAALAAYAKTALSESERKDFFDWWNAQARMEQAMKQNLPEAEGFFGEAFQGVAENLHWFIPYSMIGKGGKMVTAARGLKEEQGFLKGLAATLRPMKLGGALKEEKAALEAGKAAMEAGAAATKAAWTLDVNGVKKLGDMGSTILARQMAAVERYTQMLNGINKDLEAAKWWKDAAGTGIWAMGEAQAFSAFASEYIANADAAGISREESILTAAAIGLINAKIEKLYVPGLEASLSPAQIKSLTFAAMAQAIRSDGAAGFRKWLANRVAYGVREGVKVAATEGLVEEPLQQMAIEHGKAFDKLCQELKENGNATAANEAKALWDSIVATLPQDYATFIDTAADMLPSSIGFGVTTIGNMTRRQHIQNVMVRHANRRAGSTSTMGTAQSMEELMGATDYDAGVVDMIQRAVGVRNAMEQHWQGEGGEGQNNPHRFEEAITAARQAFRNSQGGDVVREVAQAAGVDVKTAEVLTQYLQVETEAAAFSPTVRAWTALNMSLADIDEQTIKTILPGYVEGSFAADPEAGVYSGKVKLVDGSERTIAYKVGDISEELMKQAEVNSKVNSAFGRSWDARIEENNSRGIVDGAIAADMTRKWAELSDWERYTAAVRAQASVNGFSSGTSGVFELTDAKGEKVRVNADDIIYLASGRIADIGYGAAATQGTVRHETFHSLWRFVRASLDDADVQALAKTLGVDVTKDGWEVELDEKMAHQMERYASGHYVSHAVSSRFDKMLDGWAGKLVNFFGKIGQRDEVLDPNTGKPYQLKNLYDRVLRGELGSGALGVELAKIPEQPAGEAAATKSAMPVEVTDAERAAAEEEMRQGVDESGKSDEKLVRPESAQTQAETATVDEKKDGAQKLVHSSVPVATSENPADASTPNQRYYRVGLPNSNVKLVGRLEVRDAETGLVTSTDADYHDRGNQNRDDKSEESRALVEKIGANPDPLQVGTVQPIASNGIVWALPNGDVIIGNHRVNGVRLGYEKGTTGELEKFVREDAAKRGIEIGENVKKPITVFVLERIESPDGTLDKAGFDEQVHEVVRLANELQNRGFNVREQAANDAKIIVDNNLLPRMAFRADGRIDETKSGDAIGKFRQETGAQGMIAEDGSLTEEGQTRLQNAALAALLGRGENAALLQKIMANAGRLDMQNELRALMKMTPELMSLAEAKPAYDLRGPLAEALQLFTEWRDKDETARVEKGKTRHDWRETAKDGHRVRGISWEQFMSQGDMFRTPSDEAKILGDLFARAEAERSFDREDVESAVGKKRAIDLVSNYLTDYIENARAVNTETEDIFGGSPASRAEVMAAQRVNPAGGVRFSVDPAKVRPATKEEYNAALSTWGDMKIDTGNVASAGWIFPDGRVLKPKMQRTAFGMTPHHDSLFAFLERPERSNDVEKFEYGYADSLAGGAVRLNLGNGGIEVMRLPTAEQLDTLYDALDAGYELMEDEGEDVLRVDVDRENGAVAFTAQYRRGTSARRIMDDLREWFDEKKVPAAANARFSISGIYTGTAADYANRSRQGGVDDGPSLLKIGTGEGAQVYGWGLYGSTVRGVAEGYANPSGRISEVLVNGERHKAVGVYEVVASMLKNGDAKEFIKDTLGALDEMQYALDESGKSSTTYGIRTIDQKYIDKRRAEIKEAQRIISEGATLAKPGNLYEQTFFTNRAPGDESHLLKWYEPVSEEQRKWIADELVKEGWQRTRDTVRTVYGQEYDSYHKGENEKDYENKIHLFKGAKASELYRDLSELLGTPQAASEFLARAGIDGVKYPVDSYGGKGVKDGDEVGWNYVSFRDDNIRVDHKWTDGQQRYSIAQTATPQFKRWFGDWEKDPENASKVVDEEGKPLVVYHGSRTGANIRIFNTPSFFSSSRDVADMFKKEADFILRVNGKEVAIDDITARQISEELTKGDYTPDEMAGWGSFADLIGDIEDNGKSYGGRDVIADALAYVGIDTPLGEITEMSFKRVPDIYACYLNIRKPLEIDFKGKTWGQDGTKEMEQAVRDAAKNGYDGVIVRNIREGGFTSELRNGEEPPLSTDYIPISPEQIKSATDNTGTFSPINSDIRYSVFVGIRGAENSTDIPAMRGYNIAEKAMEGRKWDEMSRDDKLKFRAATGYTMGADGYFRREVQNPKLSDKIAAMYKGQGDAKKLKDINAAFGFKGEYIHSVDSWEKLKDTYSQYVSEVEDRIPKIKERYAELLKDVASDELRRFFVSQMEREIGLEEKLMAEYKKKVSLADDAITEARKTDAWKKNIRPFEAKIGDVLTGETMDLLKKYYPGIEDIKFRIDTQKDDPGLMGWFSEKKNEICLTREGAGRGMDEVAGTLIHELQHVIQQREGWAPGGNEMSTAIFKIRGEDFATWYVEDAKRLIKELDEIVERSSKRKGLFASIGRKLDIEAASVIIDVHSHFLKEYVKPPTGNLKGLGEIKDYVNRCRHFVDKAQRLIDYIRGLQSGMSGKVSYDEYKALIGEVEARNAARRNENDAPSLPEDTEDVPRAKQLNVLSFNDLFKNSILPPPTPAAVRYSVSSDLVDAMRRRAAEGDGRRYSMASLSTRFDDALPSAEAYREGRTSYGRFDRYAGASLNAIAAAENGQMPLKALYALFGAKTKQHKDFIATVFTDQDIPREWHHLGKKANEIYFSNRDTLNYPVTDITLFAVENFKPVADEHIERVAKIERDTSSRLGEIADRIKKENTRIEKQPGQERVADPEVQQEYTAIRNEMRHKYLKVSKEEWNALRERKNELASRMYSLKDVEREVKVTPSGKELEALLAADPEAKSLVEKTKRDILEAFERAKPVSRTLDADAAEGEIEKLVKSDSVRKSRFSVESPRFRYPNPLNALSDDELIAAAVAARMALGKSDRISDRAIKINTVQQLMRRLHPDWTDTDIGRESNRIVSDARKLGKKIREDLDRGVSESLILEHLPDAAREQFGREMREEARKGQRLGVFAQRVKGEIDERQARMVEDAVRVQTGLDVANIENAYGINLSETIMHLAENPLAEKPPQTMNGSAGEESATAADGSEGESAEGAVEIDAKVKAAVNDILAASRTAAEADERNRKDRRAAAGRAEERKAEAGESGDEGSDAGDALGEGDFLVNAVKKEGVDLENPRHLARFVAELARRQWIKEHGLKQNAEVWRDLVAVQFLRKTAQSVYAKLCRDLTYSRGRETAMQHIARFDAAPTVAGLMSEMEFVGALINARRIRDTQQQKCEQLDLFLRERFGAQGRFKPDKEEGKRKVSAEAELRARYMRHAMWLTPDAAAEEARQLQETLDALSVDFKDAGRDVDQSREFVETIRNLNVLREFGALRYKPIGDIDAAAQWWEDFERGSSDDIVREMSDRDIRTKKAAHLLAVAFADPKRTAIREGGKADALNRFITGHMGFISLLQDCMRHASDADAAAVKDIIDYISREIQKSGDRSEAEKRRHNDAFHSAVEGIYGKSFNAVMKDMMAPDERFTKYMGVVGGKRVTPTKGRALQLLVSLLQEGRKVQVEDEENPGQTKTVWEGGYHDNIVKHHREGQAAEIMRLLDPADMNMLKWLGQWYENNRADLSGVCHSLFGIGVYAELPNYFPVKMQLETQGLEKGNGVGWTIFPKALTPRVRNERDFDTSADIFSMWASRMEEAAQWKHHAQLGLEMRGIFGRAELREAVRANHGASVDELMQGFITDILAGHGAYDRSTAGVQYFSDQIRGWTALCALGGNVGVMAKQTTSIPAFGFEIGLVNTAKYMVNAFTPEGIAAMRRIWDSEQRRTRWQVGSSEAVRNALNQQGAGALKRMFQASMITNKLGDVVPALVVGQGIYRDCLARGMSEEDAMAETWSIIERTQQSGRMENQTSIQRRNKLGRIMFQFLSTQQQYLQYEVRAIREVIARPDSVKRWGSLGRAILLNHFILSSAYYWMGQLYKYALGQEPPEDELKDWIITCLLGPYGSLFVAGFCCKYTLERAIKGYSIKGGSSMLPMESWLKNQVNDGAKLLEAIFDSDGDTWDNMLEAAGRWMSDSNSTVRDLRKLYRYRIKKEPQNRK